MWITTIIYLYIYVFLLRLHIIRNAFVRDTIFSLAIKSSINVFLLNNTENECSCTIYSRTIFLLTKFI